MAKYLRRYMEYITKKLDATEKNGIAGLIDEHKTMICFMQHERLIHFLVTMLVAVLFFITLAILAVTDKIEFLPITVLLLALVMPYIAHYYFMENTVQKMYVIYNDMIKKQESDSK